MGTTIGKISTIKKHYPTGLNTLESSLSAKGYDRYPGTYTMILPFQEMSGKYRTGLDVDATYLNVLSPEEKKIKQAEIIEAKKRLEDATGLDLSPRSDYYNYASQAQEKVQAVKLRHGDNIFNLNVPIQEITFSWIGAHPTIASSYKAYESGTYPSTTQFYVNNDNIEQELTFKKKSMINKAIAKNENLNPEVRRKVARLLGLPVSDDSKEMTVYNLVDSWIKQGDIVKGEFRGQNAVDLFVKFADMDKKLLQIKDITEQAIKHSIYKQKLGGKIFEGELEVFRTKEELVEYLYSDKGQEDLLALEDKLNVKKSTLVH